MIKSLRKKKGLSQRQLASKVGMTQARISFLESGKEKITMYKAAKIGAALGVEAKEIFTAGSKAKTANVGPTKVRKANLKPIKKAKPGPKPKLVIVHKPSTKGVRLGKGWTQAKLSKKSGVAPALISKAESGYRPLTHTNLMKVCLALKVNQHDVADKPRGADFKPGTTKAKPAIKKVKPTKEVMKKAIRVALKQNNMVQKIMSIKDEKLLDTIASYVEFVNK